MQRSSNETQWEIPAQVIEGARAFGWSIELDPGTGRAFYSYEAMGGDSQWEIPASLAPLMVETDGVDAASEGIRSRPSTRGSRRSRCSRPASRASRPASRGSNSSGPSGSRAPGSRPGSRTGSRDAGREIEEERQTK